MVKWLYWSLLNDKLEGTKKFLHIECTVFTKVLHLNYID